MSGNGQRAFRVVGMDCAEEIALLRREVGPVVGGDHALSFDLLRARMTVDGAVDVSEADILEAVRRAGLDASPWKAGSPERDGGIDRLRRRRAAATIVSGIATAAGFITHALVANDLALAFGREGLGGGHSVPLAAKAAYAVAVAAGLVVVGPKAWAALRRLRPDMNLLMTIAVSGAIVIGEWFEAATVAFLFALSLAIEAWSVGRARRAIEKLLDLVPPTARLVTGTREEEVAPSEVPIGSRIAVRPGERIPLDGRIVNGGSSVNQAPITGESTPLRRDVGDSVFAGSINGSGALELETTAAANATMVAKILRLVEQAQSKRSQAERWVERFAAVYTPVVLALATALAVIPPLVGAGTWADWGYRALVLLVIGCPCALVVSTPVAVVAGLAATARHGVLVKGGVVLEAPSQLKTIAFDKTGTLTQGRPRVLEVVPLAGHDEAELLERLVALEARSEHPLAAAVRDFAATRGVAALPAEDFEAIEGKGARGTIEGRPFWVGSHRYLEERGQETPEVHARLEELSLAGQTALVVGNEAHVCGFVTVADGVRPEASAVIAELRKLGVASVMLTGDNEGTARAIAKSLGISDVRAELLPDEKVAAIEELVERDGAVAMVGDGINDAPALARAALGIAMGKEGSDAAIETADVALLADDLTRVPWLVRHSRRTVAVVRENVAFALVVKAIFATLALVGMGSLWGAIAADMGASLIVIANSLRLLRS